MEKQKRLAMVINALCIFAIVSMETYRLLSLIFITLILLVNFWHLMALKK